MGRGNRSNLLYMLDFGLAKPFMNLMTGEHNPFRTGLVWVGTARYMSYNVHFGRGMLFRMRDIFSFSDMRRNLQSLPDATIWRRSGTAYSICSMDDCRGRAYMDPPFLRKRCASGR